VVLSLALVAVLARGGGATSSSATTSTSPSGSPSGSPRATSRAAAGEIFAWSRLEPENSLVEANVNGDAVPDFVGVCSLTAEDRNGSLCAFDGATMRLAWQKPIGKEQGAPSLLVSTGRFIVAIDDGGVVHVLEPSTGNEAGAVRLGGHAGWACTLPESPGKVWIRSKQPRAMMLDVATRTLTDAPRPASCPRGRREHDCWDERTPQVCPAHQPEIKEPGVGMDEHVVERGRGVALGHKNTDISFMMLLGFEPNADTSKPSRVVWKRPVAPGDGLGSAGSGHMFHFGLAAGRAVTGYDTPSGETKLVAVDAASGRTLWEVPTPDFSGLVLTAARVYILAGSRLHVRDAATGAAIGGVGTGRE
jgi:outer membrane protein assembly factor BamB